MSGLIWIQAVEPSDGIPVLFWFFFFKKGDTGWNFIKCDCISDPELCFFLAVGTVGMTLTLGLHSLSMDFGQIKNTCV